MASVPKSALRTIFASLSGLNPLQVVWDGEGLPFGQRLHLAVVARRSLGVDEELREYPTPNTTRITLRGQRVLTISVRAENFDADEAFDLLERIRLAAGQDDVRASIRSSADVALTSATDIRPVPATSDNRTIRVATMDLFFNQAVEKVIDVNQGGYIEVVEMTGEDDLDLAGTFEVNGTTP